MWITCGITYERGFQTTLYKGKEHMKDESLNVLIVDDVSSNLTILSEMVKGMGYMARPVPSVEMAMKAIEVKLPQLILLDISMPDINGFEFCEMLKKDPATKDVPVIFISAMTSPDDRVKGFTLGAVDFITKPFELREVTVRINTHLKMYLMQKVMEDYNHRLTMMINSQVKRGDKQQGKILSGIADMLEKRDKFTIGHRENISRNGHVFSVALQLNPKYEHQIDNNFMEHIDVAAALHDIGKICIPESILLKPERLSPEEFESVKAHCEFGAESILNMAEDEEDNYFLILAADIARYHHERWDGSGYPYGKKGEEIPIGARIVAILDTYDALTHDRVYRKAYSREEAVGIIENEAGKAFDPEMVKIFIRIHNRIKSDN